MVGRAAHAHHGGVLVTRLLGRVQQPQRAIGGGEEHRVLLRPLSVVRELHGLGPLLGPGRQARHEDRDVRAAFHRAAKPHAGQAAVAQHHEVGGMGLNAGRGQVGHLAGGVIGVLLQQAVGHGCLQKVWGVACMAAGRPCWRRGARGLGQWSVGLDLGGFDQVAHALVFVGQERAQLVGVATAHRYAQVAQLASHLRLLECLGQRG